jgi:hypothetical protein
MRFRPILLAVSCLAPLAACASAGPSPSAAPPADVAAWDTASSPDSIAAWALAGCRGLLGTSAGCVERRLLASLPTAGVAKTMAALDRLVERNGTVRHEAHGTAHSLGIHAYRSPETVAETFAACPPTQMSGCYHGVVQGYFLAMQRQPGGLSDAALNAVCEPHRRSEFLFFQCAHGVGHGVMAVAAHHLPRALELCDRAADAFVRESCYGGVFMENIVAFIHPHHTAEAHAAVAAAGTEHDGHGEMDHGGQHAGTGDGKAERWKPLDPSEPLYPCTVVAEKYRGSCYMNQTSAILYMTLGRVGPVARQCARVPNDEHRRACYRSLGRDVTALARRGHARSLELCRRAGEQGERWCIEGVAENLVNLAADPGEGIRFCGLVRGDAKGTCYESVGRMLHALERDPARREAVCATVEAAHAGACRAGAALPARERSSAR